MYPPRALLRAFLALWLVTGLVLLYGSVATALTGLRAHGHVHPHLVILGPVEAVAAVLFLVPRALRWGAAGLLLTIGIAFLVHLTMGQFRGDLLIYGVVAAFVMVHGPLTAEQLKTALGRGES